MMQVTLPWPSPKLNPNRSRGQHWGKRAKLSKRYKIDCGWACKAAGLRPLAAARAAVSITFHPPDANRRDLDNMLAAIKSGLDAVSVAVAVDDGLSELTLARGAPVSGGAVVVTIAAAASADQPQPSPPIVRTAA
ncbi:hypothetical protein KZ810_13095 [Sphingomonas sp. RHCKR47]|uniref:hypothetical protein n=1 Tax=Sphingomonas citricola TaxID=2862498 RepID=UPI001CA534E4|nr:hypothetical protein [Sphingomonas citricola]MBW6524438.1 hypothetical protein [Sphingomonas citricola]